MFNSDFFPEFKGHFLHFRSYILFDQKYLRSPIKKKLPSTDDVLKIMKSVS